MAEAQIVSDPNVAFGKPVIAGTRIAVELILEEFGAGETLDSILENHPQLTRAQILAALSYAKEAVNALSLRRQQNAVDSSEPGDSTTI